MCDWTSVKRTARREWGSQAAHSEKDSLKRAGDIFGQITMGQGYTWGCSLGRRSWGSLDPIRQVRIGSCVNIIKKQKVSKHKITAKRTS